MYCQNLTLSGTFTYSGTGALSAKNIEGIRFADQFSGASVTAKLDNALADATTLLVVAPSTLGAGSATSISTGKCILDLRSGPPKFFTNASVSSAALTLNDDGTLSGTFKSTSASPSATGVFRLANTEQIKSRNAANAADLNVAKMNASNILEVGDAGGAQLAGPLTGVTNITMNGALAGATTGAFSGVITSTLATGTAPLSVASTTVVPTLNVQVLNGVTVSGAPSANQVLTASSATAASWASLTSSGFSILNKQDIAGEITGNSADQTMYTYSLPSGTLAASKGIRITAYFFHSTGTASVAYKVFFGATSITACSSTSGNVACITAMVFNNTGSTTAQWLSGTNTLTTTGASAAPAENTNSGSAITVKVTFNVANTDGVTPRGFLVELIS